jgi:PAS domain-containing protein
MRYLAIIIWLFCSLMANNLSAHELNLDNKFYIHRGFSSDWVNRMPLDLNDWFVFDTIAMGKHQIRIVDLPLHEKQHKKNWFSIAEVLPHTYTMITSFNVPDRSILEGKALGLWIPQIAENWEVYLNGRLIRGEVYLDQDGFINKFRNMRDVLVYLNPLHMKAGLNIIAFKIIGDPNIQDTGFYQNNPLLIGSYEKLERARAKIIPTILIFIYLLVGMYHLVLFLVRRSERYNLIFALFSIMLFIYLLSRTGNIYSIIADTKYSYLIEFCSLYTLFPLLLYFMDIILFKRVRLFVHVYGLYCLALILLSLVLSYSARIDILRIWQYSSPVALLYFLPFQIGYSFFNQVRGYRAADRGNGKPGMMSAFGHCIARTTAGNLLLGSLVSAGCAVFDIVNSIYFNFPIVITNYGFLVFVIGITLMLSNRFVILYRKIDGLNFDLRERTRDLRETRVQYDFSKEKYRLLVEGTKDVIFSLDEKLTFITANRTLLEILGTDEESIMTQSLFDILHDTDERSVTAQFVEEKIENFLKDNKPITLKLDFKTTLGIEPVSLQVHLETIRIDGRNEIFGRGTSVSEDVLNKYLQSERQNYRIGNLLLVADDLSYRITRNLQKFIDKREMNLLRIAVREIIINAIEHGNLAITFEEKSREMTGDNYFQYLNERQKDPRFRDRGVTIDYHVDRDRVIYTITDEGMGFDYRKFLNGDVDVNESMLAHGRGITLAKNIFDDIRFNESGNEVSLIKMLKEEQ